MKLSKKNLLVTAYLLCSSVIVLNAQSSISFFLSEESYIGEASPFNESFEYYLIENQTDYKNNFSQLRNGDTIEVMGEDTPDPGNVAIHDTYLFWIIMASLYGFRLFFKKKKKTLRLRNFAPFAFKSKKIRLLLSVLTCIPLSSFSSEEYSFNLSVDPSVAYLYGDVAGVNRVSTSFDDLKLEHIRYMLGCGIRQKINLRFSHKVGFYLGHFVADEQKNTRLSYRGYAYNTKLYQLGWQPEFTFLHLQQSEAYLFSGIGIAYSSSKLTGSTIRPSDKFKSSETAAFTPFGIGYEIALSERWSLNTEVVCFYYFSDLIDGITTRHSNYNDVVGAVFFSFSYKTGKDTGLYSKKRNAAKRYKCFL